MQDDVENDIANDIAIIGMACRFPGADNPDEYWQNLAEGKESLSTLSDEDLKRAGVPEEIYSKPNYVKAGMFLQHMQSFDAGFFGFSPLDAKIMDPQHRHFLECCWETFENAGYDPSALDSAVGVYAGSGHNAYMPYNLLSNAELLEDVGFFLIRHTGNDKDFLTTRASYCFDLKGPSINVQTACSTSLVAIHQAAQSLLNGECDMALAGGVTIDLPHNQGYLFKENEILSTDGHCRPFDAASTGTIFGSGVGVVLLKRLEDAQADGDFIHAVIKSSAINNDGADKVSYLAPSVDGQVAAMREALDIAEIDPQSVEYIECHGTGTQLGDPIEVAAMTQAYGLDNPRKQYCALGAVKSNIGHLDTAAGIAGVIKVVESLKHRQIPATLHYQNANPSIDFPNSPFFVNAELRDWRNEGQRRAAVSSLGVGGTNAHVILEEAEQEELPVAAEQKPRMIPLSARSDQSLLKYSTRLSDFLETQLEKSCATRMNLDNIAYTLTVGRKQFVRRGFALLDDLSGAAEALSNAGERLIDASAMPEEREIAFMFAGGGAQYPNMGRGLYDTEPVYRDAVDESLALISEFIDYDLKALLFPDPESIDQAAQELEKPSRTLPALFITQYAQAQLWQSWGVSPSAMIGHSMGENTAACVAGVLSLKDALGLVALRGRLFDSIPHSGMLSVQLGEEDLKPLLGDLDIAAVNAEGLSVASGNIDALEELEKKLDACEASYQRVHINIAAHSRMLDGILKEFGDYLRSITLNKPSIPFLSNLSGDWISDEQATDPEYWVAHLRNTVRFADGAAKLLQDNTYVLLEVGAGKTLTNLSSANTEFSLQHNALNSMRHPEEDEPDQYFMLATLGALWQSGATVDWEAYFADTPKQRVPLPTYCFDHQNYWVEPGRTAFAGPMATQKIAKGEGIGDWLYQPVWRRSTGAPSLTDDALSDATVVLMCFQPEQISTLRSRLMASGAKVVVVSHDEQLSVSSTGFTLDWYKPAHYLKLVTELLSRYQPTHIVHTLNAELVETDANQKLIASEAIDKFKAASFDSLFLLAQALGSEVYEEPLKWLVLSQGAQQLAGEVVSQPWQSLSLGPVRVLPREFPNFSMTLLDVGCAVSDSCVVQPISEELIRTDEDSLLAYRNGVRYHQQIETLDFSADAGVPMQTRDQGVYLITGGLGGLGLLAAQALSASQPVRLVLLGRHEFPRREHWEALLDQNAPESSALETLLAIEANGSQVMTVACDIADVAALETVRQTIVQRWGEVNGIIHTAGVIDDKLLQLKDLDEAHAVLKPKLEGTLALSQVFDPAALDFLVIYSSTSAFMGLAGQTDYAAANAFLDAFAHYQHSLGNRHVSTINWPAWKSAGMAANIATGNQNRRLPAGTPVDHPMLDRCTLSSTDEVEFVSLFSVEDDWVISEHRLRDSECLMPGTGFIELIRSAFEQVANVRGAQISNVAFMLPFVVPAGQPQPLFIKLTKHSSDDDSYQVLIYSFTEGEQVEHVSASVSAAPALLSETVDIQSLMSSCNGSQQLFTDPDHHPLLDFGQRWACLQKVHYGQNQAVVEINVDSAYEKELSGYGLHPAVMDMAIAGAQGLIDGYDPQSELYVPVGYRSLVCGELLPAKIYSHVQYRVRPEDQSREIVEFDVDLLNENGVSLVQVRGFTMQRIADVKALAKSVQSTLSSEPDSGLVKTLELGISNTEGVEVLANVIAGGLGPQLAVSVYDLDLVSQELLAPFQIAEEKTSIEDLHNPDADPDIAQLQSVLEANEALEQVIVRSFLDEVGDRRLIAYYLQDWDHTITVSEIRRFAKTALTAELLPQQFVECDEFPVDADGNIDKDQLLDPFVPKDHYIAPESATQKAVAKIWQEVLGVSRIGLTDNFFDAGGHSLLSIRAIVKTEKKFAVRLDQAIMVLQTLEQISAEIDSRTGATEELVVKDESSKVATVDENLLSAQEAKKGNTFIKTLFGRKK